MSIRKQIISTIETNRISSTQIADCLDKTGAISQIKAVNKGHFKVGEVFWVYAYDETNWTVHDQLRDLKENSIFIISAFNCKDRAIIGDIVSKYILLYKRCKAIVVIGNIRDANRILKENWPIWCMGFNPVGCFNSFVKYKEDKNIKNERNKFKNSIAICDDTGVVIVEKKYQSSNFIKKLEFIEDQEDIWYDCIDHKKWNTYDTICLKKYLKK